MRCVILDKISDIAPISVCDIAIQPGMFFQQHRKKIFAEIKFAAVGNALEGFRLENINTGIDRIAKNLTPRWLFEKANDASVLFGNDDSELERIFYASE